MESRARSITRVLSLLLGFFVLSIVGGLILAGLAIPVAGAAGSATKGTVRAFDDLPSDFNISPLAQGSKILDASGGLIANPYDENRIVVSLDQISPWMQKAQIAIEDSRFYDHGGLDIRGFGRAFLSNLGGGSVQGASTLTQQYVKITLQENALRRDDKAAAAAAVEKSYIRKLQELKYALNVEQNYTKDQILTGYLNLVYYGDLSYGVEAAAQNYFGISAKDLNLSQAALLAGIVQQPGAFNPVDHPEAAQKRRDVVLERMVATGVATQAEADEARAVDVKSMIHKKPVKGVCQRSSQPYFCAFIMEWLQKSPQMEALGKTPAERLKNINQGGLTIRTTLDPALQEQALARVTEAVPTDNNQGLGGAASVVEPGTGKILAMVQSSDFASNQVNWNVDQKYGGGPYGYQFGSVAKIYALVTALEKGMPVNGSVYAPQAGPGQPYYFQRSQVHDDCGMDKTWPVQNDYFTGGDMPLRVATANSVNTAFANLVLTLGGCTVRDTMTKMGLHMSNGDPIEPVMSAITLGASTTTPLTLASSVATLAARGNYCEPMPVVSITTFDGKEVPVPQAKCDQVVPAEVADGVNELLQGVLEFGTAAGSGYSGNSPAAGKTGTTDQHNQAWFVGYTPTVTTAVWIGNVVPTDEYGRMKTLNGKKFGIYGWQGNVFGGTIAAPVWAKIMNAATAGRDSADFTPPTNAILNGNLVSFPNVLGMAPQRAIATLRAAGFDAYIGGTIDSGYPAGTVGGTSPRGQVAQGGSIGLLISNGYSQPSDSGASPSSDSSQQPRDGQ